MAWLHSNWIFYYIQLDVLNGQSHLWNKTKKNESFIMYMFVSLIQSNPQLLHISSHLFYNWIKWLFQEEKLKHKNAHFFFLKVFHFKNVDYKWRFDCSFYFGSKIIYDQRLCGVYFELYFSMFRFISNVENFSNFHGSNLVHTT